jgi:hypothetical protein
MNNVGKSKSCVRPNKKSFRKGTFSKNKKSNCRLSMKSCKQYQISSRKYSPLHNWKKKSPKSVWVDLCKWLIDSYWKFRLKNVHRTLSASGKLLI